MIITNAPPICIGGAFVMETSIVDLSEHIADKQFSFVLNDVKRIFSHSLTVHVLPLVELIITFKVWE